MPKKSQRITITYSARIVAAYKVAYNTNFKSNELDEAINILQHRHIMSHKASL